VQNQVGAGVNFAETKMDRRPSIFFLLLVLSWLGGVVIIRVIKHGYQLMSGKKSLAPNQPIPLLSQSTTLSTSNASPHPTTTNFKEGFYVASLQGVPGAAPENKHRLDTFKTYMESMCPSIQIQHCPGVIDTRPGYGIATTWTNCLQRALDIDDVDIAYFFEDDARIYNDLQYNDSKQHPFCSRALREKLWWSAPIDTFLILFGGWHFRYGNGKVVDGSSDIGTFYETDNSWGSYAWAVPSKENMRSLLKGFQSDLNGPPVHNVAGNGSLIPMISPDETKHRHALNADKLVYMLSPLWFVHPAGYSNTWGYEAANDIPIETPPWTVKSFFFIVLVPIITCFLFSVAFSFILTICNIPRKNRSNRMNIPLLYSMNTLRKKEKIFNI
jgi:hypothetical protein